MRCSRKKMLGAARWQYEFHDDSYDRKLLSLRGGGRRKDTPIPSSDWHTSTSSLMKRISLGPDWARKGAHFSCRKVPLKEMIAPRILGSSPRLARKLGPNSPGGNGISSDHSLAIVVCISASSAVSYKFTSPDDEQVDWNPYKAVLTSQ